MFIGIGNYDYCRLLARDISQVNAYDGTGNTLSIAANRLSYTLNLRGPSVVVETACSSSLVATHFACRSLQSGESDLCLVGGVSLMLSPEPFITYSHARMMAADGRCKTFDARADGYVRGEGCGVVVLKRLGDAIQAGDRIQGVIRGSAINQDGMSNGLTAPNGPSQQAVIRQALKNAGLTPDQISYVEAHGTGTALGDPIEFKALKAVFAPARPPQQPCWIGSVKTNIGHLEAAAGIASVIKVALAMQHQELPPHLHFQQANPYMALEGTPFAIPTQRQPWTVKGTRMAGISAFGFGGTNCHLVMEEAHPEFSGSIPAQTITQEHPPLPLSELNESARTMHLLTLSAKTEPALQDLAIAYQNFLAKHPQVDLADVCFTANTGRSHFDQRLAVLADSPAQMQARLEAFIQGDAPEGGVRVSRTRRTRPKVAFLFTGQGAQYVEMGRKLYETQPVFRTAMEHCDRLLRPHLDLPLLEVIYPEQPDAEIAALLDHTAYTQPALFALEYALAQLWQSWGVEPTLVMGHSVGEYAAACIAGVFSLEDGLKLIAARARLMQALPMTGAMVAVFASQEQVQAAIQAYPDQVAIAAINGPQSMVISGEQGAIAAVVADLQASGIKTKPLQVSHAFHSPLMEPMLAEFEQIASAIHYSAPRLKLISNLTGELATGAIATPEYWCRHIRQPVQFAPSMATLRQQGYELLVEIGPKPILLGMGRTCWPQGEGLWLPSLHPQQDNWQTLLQTLAHLYGRGVAVNWAAIDRGDQRHRLDLPTYPFQRQRYWANISESDSTKTEINGKHAAANSLNLPMGNKAIAQLTAKMTATGELSADELELLPKLLNLITQHQVPSTSDSRQDSIQDWLYEIQWQPQPRQPQSPASNGSHVPTSWLILMDTTGTGDALAMQLEAQGDTCYRVYSGDTFQQRQDGSWQINPTQPGDCDRLLSQLAATRDRPLQGVLHLWNLEAAVPDQLTLSTLEQAQIDGVASVLHLVQALVNHTDQQNPSPRLWVMTRGAVAVAGSLKAPPAVAQAAVWGLGRVIALEHRELWGGLIDLSPTVEGSTSQALTALLQEIQSPTGEDHLALRDGQRYGARLGRSHPPAHSQELPATVHSNATYLITGGLGALGLQVAMWLVEQGARQLVLTGRRAASPQAQATIDQLQRAGVGVLVVQADVACEADVARVMALINTDLPPLRGIIHAAGVLDDGILLQQTWERFTRVMAAKVQGTWNLHQLTQDQPLDFFRDVLLGSGPTGIARAGQLRCRQCLSGWVGSLPSQLGTACPQPQLGSLAANWDGGQFERSSSDPFGRSGNSGDRP